MDGVAGLINGALWAILPSGLFVLLLWWIDKHEKEPGHLLGLSLLGGLGAFLVVLAISAIPGLERTLVPPAIAPEGLLVARLVIPIVVQAAVLVGFFIWLGSEFGGPLDGIVYGGIIGAGFALGQNFHYFSQTVGNLIAVPFSSQLAIAISSLNHSFAAAVVGAGLGFLRSSGRDRPSWWAPVVGLAAALGLSLAHELVPALSQILAGVLPPGLLLWVGLILQASNGLGLIILAILVGWAWEHEAAIIEEQLADEVIDRVIPEEDYQALSSSFGRWGREIDGLISHGLRYWLGLRHLHAPETELAFRKWHQQKSEALKDQQRQLDEAAYRQQIRALRIKLGQMEEALR